MSSSTFSAIPIEGFLGFVLLITFASIFLGFTLGRRFRDKKSEGDAPPIGSVIGALFALLAFMLALTFSSASNRYDTRKQLLLNEVNAIGTAFLRASFLENEDTQYSQTLLKDYVQRRMNIVNESDSLNVLIVESERIHKELWDIVLKYPKSDVGGALTASYAAALNDMFDLHNSRVVVGISYHIHPSVWAVLLSISALSMAALGFQFAYSGGRRVWLCMLLATTFSLVLFLIEDLDRPEQGTVRVYQEPMAALFKSMTLDNSSE
jgi:hypothetical protein